MDLGKLYFKHFSVTYDRDFNYCDIIVSLADHKQTLGLVKYLLQKGSQYSINYDSIIPVLFKWGRNKKI